MGSLGRLLVSQDEDKFALGIVLTLSSPRHGILLLFSETLHVQVLHLHPFGAVDRQVFRLLAARRRFVDITPLRSLRLGALSLGIEVLHSLVNSQTGLRTQRARDANFWGQGKASGVFTVYPRSACSLLLSFSEHPEWLLTFKRRTGSWQWRSTPTSCMMTSKCMTSVGSGL
jgi:hypothetical protein